MGLLVTLLFFAVTAYVLWYKLILVYTRYYFYKNQGIRILDFPLPLVGNYLIFKRFLKFTSERIVNPFTDTYISVFGKVLPTIFIDFKGPNPTIIMNDPKLLEDLFIKKNKYFDKHPKHKNRLFALFGNSLIFDQSSEQWVHKRKEMSLAFYKEKMQRMGEIIVNITIKRVDEWVVQYNGKEMDIFRQTAELLNQCITTCILGGDAAAQKLDYYTNGEAEQKSIAQVLEKLMPQVFGRAFKGKRLLFDIFDNVFIGAHEKEVLRNIQTFRSLIKEMIRQRRQATPQEANDFLTIMLNNSLYGKDEDMMVDECVTFFFAGIQVTRNVIQNLLFRLIQNPEVRAKLKHEVDIIYQKCSDSTKIFDQLDQMQYTQMVIQETLRIDTPIQLSTPIRLQETTTIGDYKIIKNDMIQVHLWYIHRNPEQWQLPDKFIPERFDPESSYYLTPNHQKRHPLSFVPFLGGKRICLGKTFAEILIKAIVPQIVHNLNFEFVNQEYYQFKPANIPILPQPEVLVKVKAL